VTNTLYGVDLESEVTPIMVRDAMAKCFSIAHREDTGLEGDVTEDYCRNIVKKAFTDSGGDYENPTKESLQKVMAKLADFAKNFRDQKIIEKHYSQILSLVNKIKPTTPDTL